MKYLLLAAVLLLACHQKNRKDRVLITTQNSHSTASLRGLAVVNENTAWASGSGGTVLRTTNGGSTWQNVAVAGADSLDFRDIEALSASTAIVLTAGYPGLILKTTDGGQRWALVYADYRPEIFFDAMDFRDNKAGIAFGDAIDGKVVIISTTDGGTTWQELPGPEALPGEGGFAASGTCITTYGTSQVWIALGTPASRVLYSDNSGQNWQAYATPMARETTGAGIFSLAFSSPTYGIAVGGNYMQPHDTTQTIAFTKNGGKTWKLLPNSGINGYKSAVTVIPDSQNWLAAGPTGVSFSNNNGVSWQLVDTTGYHTVVMADKTTGWLTGAHGKIGRITIQTQ